jgi:hypothetical protein
VRKLVLTVATVGMLSVAVTATASGGTEHIRDKFVSISWGGSDGSLPWSGAWSEIGDDGDEKKGNVRVVSSGKCASGNCLRLSALTTLLGQIGVVRAADTSDLAETTLSFDLETTASLLGSGLVVQVSDGGGWVTVAEYDWGSALSDAPTIDVSEFSSEDFSVRFVFTGALLGGEAFVDNVEITGTFVEETTTTTTAPNTTTTNSAPSTTSTTAPRTTTTQPATTPTTSRPQSSGSTPSTTSTTVAAIAVTSTTTPGGPGLDGGSDVPPPFTTPTSVDEVSTEPPAEDDVAAPDGSGIRAAARGLQADFQGVYGEVRTVSALNGVDFQANYNMAVEIIEASWGWMILLGLLVAHSIIAGLDRRGRSPDM